IGDDGTLRFSLVAEDYCLVVAEYCEQSDPTQSYMTMISARLLNTIAAETDAKVYLLHIDGQKTNPIFNVIDPKIVRISALLLSEDLGYLALARDTVEYFDPHPGPYWHYAISRKLISEVH
ncbi:MAG: hypothetical protein WAK66_15440, partial [Methylocystis sp.]